MNTTARFDADLLRRYDRQGPRYTSYPTAPQFSEAFDEDAYRDVARRSNDDPIPRRLSLYAHMPFCQSPCFYCGCNRIITRDPARAEAYLSRLVREVSMVAPLFDRDRDVVQLHLGGGTPNFFTAAQLRELVDCLHRHFHFSERADRDISIELDPRFVDADSIAALAAMGFNRASLGVQDFDPQVQAAVNRVQSVEQTLAVVAACRQNAFSSINIDLIYGLPGQNAAGFGRTLDIVIAARPDRLAVYSYAHLPQMFKAQRQIDETLLPDAERKLGLLQLAIEKLTAAGYQYIGMDHFALPADELSVALERGSLHRNFMGYTTHAESDLIGLGVSAISHIGDSYSQNPRDLSLWEHAIDNGRLPVWRGMQMGRDDLARAELIQRLMCQGVVDIAALESRHDLDFGAYFRADLVRLHPLVADGLVEYDGEELRVTSRGRMLVRNIAACFDHYLHQPTAQPLRYSRVI
jgi:oxygen-independent coproporphyrinogen III oxidase